MVDAAQGVEAQTVANTYLAIDNNLEIVPVLNKVDMPSAKVDETARQIDELHQQALQVRLAPFDSITGRLPRLVRDLAVETGKNVRLLISGETTEVDKTVVEQLFDPLIHMIRNAIDHGLETAKVRRRKNKPPQGTITLRAAHESGTIVIQVVDDGAGFDRERILAHASAARCR